MTQFYISGPTRLKPNMNCDVYEDIIEQLESHGDEAVSAPTWLLGQLPGVQRRPDWANGTMHIVHLHTLWTGQQIAECDEVILLPGWEDAPFAVRDVGLAEKYGKPVCTAHSDRGIWRLLYDGGDGESPLDRVAPQQPVDAWVGLDDEGLHKTAPSAISTWLRKRVDPLNMRPEDIDINDIAHALARQCRYNGHVGGFLSVARHCVWVSNRLKKSGYGPLTELWGLVHDAGEAYMGDMVKPLKHDPSMARFREIEHALDEVIAKKFHLPFPMPEEVHEADRFVTVEVEIGMRLRETHTSTYQEDEALFLARYEELEKELGNIF